MSNENGTVGNDEGTNPDEGDKPAMPVIDGHVAQCEKCDEPARGAVKVAKPVRLGLCGSCFEAETKEPTGFVKGAEDWATDEGMLPEIFPAKRMQVNAHPAAQIARVSLRRSGEAARRHNPKFRFFAGAQAMFRWPVGLRMTKAQFARAVEAADTGVEIH